jgi:hypothetical protein
LSFVRPDVAGVVGAVKDAGAGGKRDDSHGEIRKLNQFCLKIGTFNENGLLMSSNRKTSGQFVEAILGRPLPNEKKNLFTRSKKGGSGCLCLLQG